MFFEGTEFFDIFYYKEKSLKSALLLGFVFFSFWSFSSSYYCAKSFSEFESKWNRIHANHKITFLRENIKNPVIEIRKAVAKEAVSLAESSLETIQILAELAVDSTLPVPVREEIKLRILFHVQTVSGKAISEDLSPEQAVMEFKQAVARKSVGLEEISIESFEILKELVVDSTLPVPVREEIKLRILFHARKADKKVISEDLNSEQAYIIFGSMAVLRKLGGPAVTDFMKSFKNHPLSEFRENAVFFTPDENANEVIKVFLNDPNPVVQDQLVVKSVTAGNESALQELLKSSDIVVRKRAEAGLKILQSTEDRPDLKVFLDTSYSSWIRAFKGDSEIQKGIADRLLVDDGASRSLLVSNGGYLQIINTFFEEVFLRDRHKFFHLDPEGVTLHLVQRIGDMKKNYAKAMKLFFEGGESWDGRSLSPGLRRVNAKIKQALLEGMNRRPSEDLIELAGNEYFHEPFNGDKTFQKSIIQMANLRGGRFQERIFNHYTNNPYWRSFLEVDKMIVEGLKQVKADEWNNSYQNALTSLIQKYKNDDSSTIAEELTALKNHK